MATFTLRPKIDTDHSDAWAPNAVRSDPTKDWWEHIFGLDDDLYIWTPVINELYSASTSALIDENDLPSVSSADGKMNSLTVYARGKVTDTGGLGVFEIYSSLWPYMSARLEIAEADGWVTHSGVFDIIAHNQLNKLHDIEIGGGVRSKLTLYNAKKYLDYAYCEIDYVPAVPTISWQWIYKLNEGSLAAFNADHMYSTYLKEWGFEIRLKSTGVIVKTVTWTGRKVQGSSWLTELTYPDLEYDTTYEGRGYGITDDGKGVGSWVTFTTREPPPPAANNIGATNNPVYARTILTGEIINLDESVVVERGFEYKIQDAEPGAGDTGMEVKETSDGFADGEYSLKNKVLYDQQYIADNIVWWFRAYCKDIAENKYIADSWMKNLPTVTTQAMTSINYNKADGNGTVVSEGASELTMRGFEVKHEYSGRLPDSWKFEIAGFEGELEAKTTVNDIGVITDFYWSGDLIKTALETAGLAVEAYIITIGEMILGWPLADNCLIEGKVYKCRAFASNEFGTVYGDEVDFSTLARTYFSEDPPTIGEITIIKNENIENLPEGITASRRGFRYGTTEAADEFDVHENGSFTDGPYSMMLSDLLPDTTYYIYAYIVVEGIIYEGAMETITTDPEGTEDEDEYPTPHYSPHGQDYREISTKVFAEVLASQGIIDFSGGKKTLPITNHLIQTNPDAKTIADNYLDRFKLAKTRMSVSFPTPLPFEREDTVDFSYGALLFKEDDEGIVLFKEDGEGASVLMDQISMIIKKINSVGLIKTLESIEYIAELDLEHE